MKWQKYPELEPIRRLRYEGRELLGKRLYLTEKRDGQNVSLWLNDQDEVKISSHNLEEASPDIISRMKTVPEYNKVTELLKDEKNSYEHDYIAYGELLLHVSPTRLEPRRKYLHWILFDIFDCEADRFLGYNHVYQKAYHFKIPVVRVVDFFIPDSLDELTAKIKEALKWCRRHRREGLVGKNFKEQIFFKEKVDLPKLPKTRKFGEKPQLPEMPQERILRALQHAYDEIGDNEDWKNKRIAMPIVARHIATEAREHYYSPPRNFYKHYIETPIENLKVIKNEIKWKIGNRS